MSIDESARIVPDGNIVRKVRYLDEIDCLKSDIEGRLVELEERVKNGDDDPDTLGTEIENSKMLLEYIDKFKEMSVIFSTLRDKNAERSLLMMMNDLWAKSYPLTNLSSYEDKPDEWEKYPNDDTTYYNKRYYWLLRRQVRYASEPDKDTVLYSDLNRFEFFNLISNSIISIEPGIKNQLYTILDSMLPIEFPYHPRERVKVYVEHFSCDLNGKGSIVQTLGVTHYIPYASGKPQRIYQFFDITDGELKPINFSVYATRRQIHSKEVNSCPDDYTKVSDKDF